MTLARALRSRGSRTCFVSMELPAHLQALLEADGHQVKRLPTSVRGDELADARATLDGEAGVTACIVDHYGLGFAWEQTIQAQTDVMALDDLGRPHVSKWLLDQNYFMAPDERYAMATTAGEHRLLGPRFALLRDEFIRARAAAQVRPGTLRHVLVFLGGMDATNVTALALAAIDLGLAPEVAVTVIIGASHPARAQLQGWCAQRGNATLHVQVSDMSSYLLAADLAIGAGGSSTWERCACGLPTVALCLAENQREVIREGAVGGFVWGFEQVPAVDELAGVLKALAGAPGLIRHMSHQALGITDGQGARRVADILMPRHVSIRPALQDDARMIYDWRSSPSVMSVSRSVAGFTYDAHCEWLRKVLADPDRLLLIGVHQGRDVGVVRFDIAGDRAEVSIFLAPGTAGSGLGRALLAAAEVKLRSERPGVRTLDAWVNEGNHRSLQLFNQLGYSARISRLEKEVA